MGITLVAMRAVCLVMEVVLRLHYSFKVIAKTVIRMCLKRIKVG